MLPIGCLLFILVGLFVYAALIVPADLRDARAFHWGARSCLQLAAHAAVAALLVGLLAPPAFAADSAPPGYTVDLSSFVTTAVQLVAAVAGVIGTWALRHLGDALRLSNDAKAREVAEHAFENGLAWAKEALLREGLDLAKIQVRQQLVATAAQYVADAIPGTLKRFGITPEGVEQRLAARLDLVVAPIEAGSEPVSTTIPDRLG